MRSRRVGRARCTTPELTSSCALIDSDDDAGGAVCIADPPARRIFARTVALADVPIWQRRRNRLLSAGMSSRPPMASDPNRRARPGPSIRRSCPGKELSDDPNALAEAPFPCASVAQHEHAREPNSAGLPRQAGADAARRRRVAELAAFVEAAVARAAGAGSRAAPRSGVSRAVQSRGREVDRLALSSGPRRSRELGYDYICCLPSSVRRLAASALAGPKPAKRRCGGDGQMRCRTDVR